MTRPASRGLRIRFGLVNVPIKVGPRAWRRCLGLLMRHVDIGGINEALSPRQRVLYRRVCERKGWGIFGGGGPNPVVWNAERYRLVRGRVHPLHSAGTSRRARRFRGFNAARYVTDVVLDSIAVPGAQVAVLCTHLAPGGWKVPKAWRRDALDRSRRVLDGLIAAHLAAGRPVLVIGDTNIPGDLHLSGVRWLRGRGIDKAGIALPPDVTLSASRSGSFAAPTDHRRGIYAVARIAYIPRIRSAA